MSALGEDHRGRSILESCKESGIDTSMCTVVPGRRTATYCSIADAQGDLLVSVADMDVFDALASLQPDDEFDAFDLYVLDANMPSSFVERICETVTKPILFETVSAVKAKTVVPVLKHVSVLTPNREEVTSIATELAGDQRYAGGSIQEDARLIVQHMHALGDGSPKFVLVTLGEDGLLQVSCGRDGTITDHTHPARVVAPRDIASTNGAGDTFAGALAWSLLRRRTSQAPSSVEHELHNNIARHVSFAVDVASLALQTTEAVPSDFSTLDLLDL